MPHTQLEKVKLASKSELVSFLNNELKPKLDTRPLLQAKLDSEITSWETLAQSLENDPPSLGATPQKDSYIAPALVEANQKAADDYFDAVGLYALAMAEEAHEGLQQKMASVVDGRRQVMLSANQAYELGFIAYQKALERYQADRDDLPERGAQYRKLFGRLLALLNKMIATFNKLSKYDEDLWASDEETFCALDYSSYVPTHSFYKANVAGGTLFYDFRNNSFQLHIHCAQNATKAEAVRIKRYGQQIGRKRDGAWGLVEHFMTTYSPNWNSTTPKKC